MIQRLFRPLYNCFGTVGFVLLGLSFLQHRQTIDIHLHDTYYVIGVDFICIVLGLFFLLLWMTYQLFKKRLYSQLLTNIHVIVTFFCSAFWFVQAYTGTPRRYIDYSTFNSISGVFSFVILLFLAAQLLFLFNIIAGLFKRR
jgi:heme/copper-type cytochrome/quinol oxidase subunit 1